MTVSGDGTAAGFGPASLAAHGIDGLEPGADLRTLSLDRLRSLRREAQDEEADLSYLRRLLQGRIDILRAELARRSAPEEAPRTDSDGPVEDLVERLPEILADGPRAARYVARSVTVRTPSSARVRELVPVALATELTDLSAHGDGELDAARSRLIGYEQLLSGRRHELQRAADACGAEIGRRYRDGEASVDALLDGERRSAANNP